MMRRVQTAPGRGSAGLIVFACVAVAAGFSATAASTADVSAGSDIAERIVRQDQDLERRVVGIARARVSHPLKLSGAVGAMVVRQPASYDCTTVCQFRGWLVEAEPGLAGGQLGAGYAVVVGEKGGNEHFLSDVYLGYGIRGALLRTWGDANLRPADQTLLGVEGTFTVIRVNFSLGVFRYVGSGDPDHDWMLAGGIGWGF